MKRSVLSNLFIRFPLILVSLAVIAAPSVLLAENKNSQSAEAPVDKDPLTFLSPQILPFAALKDGKPVGFAVEILHEILRRLGRIDTIEFGEWKVVYERCLTEPDTVLLPPSRTPEREELFKWVGPLIPEKVVLFARKDSGLVINSFEEAKKVDGIATVTGYASEKLLREKGFANLVSQRSPMQGPDALKFGRVDLWISSNITMRQTAFAANVDPDLFEPLFVVKEIPSYLAFSKSVPDKVVNQWQTALDNMKRDGSWEKIVLNWIPTELLELGEVAINLNEKERLWIETHDRVKVVHYFHQPPFNLDVEDSHTGYLYDLLFEVLRLAGVKAEFVEGFSSYDSMIDALQNGTVDILTNVNSTLQLPGDIVRTAPVVKTPNAVVAKISAPKITRTSDLFGKKVAVVKGYAQDQHMDRFPQIEKVHVRNNEEGFEAVRMGRAEYFLNNLANAGYVLKKTFATDLRIAGALSYVDFPPLTLSFGIHGKDSPLPGIINKALSIVSIHTLSGLQDKWLAEEFTVMDPDRISLTPEEQAFVKAHPVIRVHNEQNWAPFNFYEHGTATGFSIDYMNLLAKKIGFQVEYVSGPTWDEFISMIKERRLDVMLNIVKTAEREKFIRFTAEPYIETPRAIVVRKDDTTVRNFRDLYGKTVAVEKGFFYEKYLKQNHPEIKIMTVKDTAETLRVVVNGDADATLGVIAVEQFLIRSHFFSNLKLVVDPGEKALRSFPQFIGVRSDWPLLAKMLDKAMGAVTDKDRVILSQKWIIQEDDDTDRIDLTPEEDAYLRNHPILQVAFDVDWPPVEFFDKDLGMNGMAADYLNRMSELLGVKFKPSRPQSWKEMLRAVEIGELDFFSAISPTPQRQEWLDFTDSYLSFPIVILTGEEVPYIGSMSDLKNKPVAVVDGYASHDLLLANHPDLTLMPVQDVKEGLMTVSTGKAFAFIGSLATVSHVMSREGLTDLKVSGKTPYSFDITMGTRKDNTVLLKILGKALASISLQERNTINSKWTSVTFEHEIDYSLIWRISAGAMIILAFVLYWNRRLKKEIAERKRAEEAAESANRAKSNFLSNMSHELRTPLNTVLGFANIMAKNKTLSSDDQKNLKIIHRSGEHLLTLINDILDLSRIEAGRVGLNEKDFDLHYFLDDFELMFEQKTQQKDLQLKFIRKSNVPRYIKTDQIKLRQVLINLISNAIKFTAKGSITVIVYSQPASPKNIQEVRPITLFFEVRDTGVGIAKADFENIFNPFIQTETCKESHEGTGLGLSISRKFVQLMGGDIIVESNVGKGSVFKFHIQAYESKGVDIYFTKPNQSMLGLAPNQPKYRILIVDDISANRQLLKNILESLGFDVREAGNGKDSIDIWRKWQPHLIWMDIRMPVMDGYEATRRIREEEQKSGSSGVVMSKRPINITKNQTQTIIIALTAGVFEKQRVEAFKAGCDDFVRKPLNEQEIFEKMQKHLGVRFVYGEGQWAVGNKQQAGWKDVLTPDALAALPTEWLTQMKQGAIRADFILISNVIDKTRQHEPALAGALGQLAEDFEYDEILTLIQQTEEGEMK